MLQVLALSTSFRLAECNVNPYLSYRRPPRLEHIKCQTSYTSKLYPIVIKILPLILKVIALSCRRYQKPVWRAYDSTPRHAD
jgi:hypothetical protein